MLARHPRPDVRGTVPKHNTPADFVLSQDTDGVTICEHQIGKIQHKDTVGRRCVDYLAQLAHIVSVKLTADLEHNRSGPRAMNFQHRPSCRVCNCQARWNIPEKYRCLADVVRRDFGNGEIRDNTNFKNAPALARESGFY
jgi:hypothetical protein